MRRILIGAALLTTVCATAGIASSGGHVTPRQSVIVNITDPVVLRGHVLMGPYLVVHDDDRMAKGEPCTSVYAFDRERGPQALEVEFMCKPAQRKICDTTTFSVRHSDAGLDVVTEYQFAGDTEAHIVPAR
jgi:hypothetical protein